MIRKTTRQKFFMQSGNSSNRRPWMLGFLGVALGIAALVLASGSPAEGQLYDNFTTDSSLNNSLWQVNGSVATNFGENLSSPPNSIVTPDLTFSPATGMQFSGINSTYEEAFIQSIQSFSEPFTLQATVTGIESDGNPFVLGISNADNSQNVEIAGDLNPANDGYYAIWEGTSNGQALGTKLVDNPAVDITYTLQILLDQSGMATLSVYLSDSLLGSTTDSVGAGPFYVVLGSWEGLPYTVGANVADWDSIQLTTPEPSTAIMLALGGIPLLLRKRKKILQ
jgi:hypothetical protein